MPSFSSFVRFHFLFVSHQLTASTQLSRTFPLRIPQRRFLYFSLDRFLHLHNHAYARTTSCTRHRVQRTDTIVLSYYRSVQLIPNSKWPSRTVEKRWKRFDEASQLVIRKARLARWRAAQRLARYIYGRGCYKLVIPRFLPSFF